MSVMRVLLLIFAIANVYVEIVRILAGNVSLAILLIATSVLQNV